MYSIRNGGKSIFVERVIRIINNKIDKNANLKSKTVYIDNIHDLVNKYNNTCHRIIKMKIVDVKPSMYIYFHKENNKEGPIFKVGNHVIIPKYKRIFAKSYFKIGLKKFLLLKKVKNTAP